MLISGSPGSILGQGTGSHVLQLTKTQCSQMNKINMLIKKKKETGLLGETTGSKAGAVKYEMIRKRLTMPEL